MVGIDFCFNFHVADARAFAAPWDAAAATERQLHALKRDRHEDVIELVVRLL